MERSTEAEQEVLEGDVRTFDEIADVRAEVSA